jgi:hypothetical protein
MHAALAHKRGEVYLKFFLEQGMCVIFRLYKINKKMH